MSIVAMRKATLCGRAADKRRLIAGLQELGCLHIIPLADAGDLPSDPDQPSPDEAHRALQYLRSAPYVRSGVAAADEADVATAVRQALDNKDRRRDLIDRRDQLRDRLAALAPWGDFTLPEDPAALGGYRLWFYAVPHRQAAALRDIPYPWIQAAQTHRDHYIVVLARERPPAGMLPVRPVDTDGKGTTTLRRELRETESALEDLEIERIALTRHIPAIRRGMARAADLEALRHATATAYEAAPLFAVQAWLPAARAGELQAFVQAQGAALRIEPAGPGELPPTLLDNPALLRPGEDLAQFYQVPPASDWDPSGVLLASFAVFFAMILSDAGYGAVVLLLAAAPLGLWRSALGARLRRMTAALGIASVVFGVLAGSIFGMGPPAGSLVGALNLVDLRDYEGAMRLSVLIGVLHVALGNAALAVAHWPRRPAIARLGWIAVALGGFAAWTAGEAYGRDGIYAGLALVAAGLLLVLAFASERPVQGPLDHLRRARDGLLGLASVTRVFGDVLSYLRLFALGLATAMLASAFNDIGGQLRDAIPGLGLVLAILVVLLGHALTFALAVVSGVVHGLRLDFIEFYAWGLSGEGYAFRPLERTERRL